ncbi:arginine--tRNA ligase [candidate division WOR-1 bacterium RIFOXYA2_FULL_36_21]|nr:MAG: arginine--tRNA ligase [candidate division WOR-1 bacterium RIFOXYA2_FULL_36_21]OGC18593.1 MAG: arginine--tRNA ligase [candidate division WOR-1 bacterium RIFOXYA12_FULL_36_13]
MKEHIGKLVLDSVLKVFPNVGLPRIEISVPQERYGDFSTNVALLLVATLKNPPYEIAKVIAKELETSANIFEKVEATKNGFVNFTLSLKFLQDFVKEIILKDKEYGKVNIGNGQKVLIEFVSANPTGPLHVGHGRWSVIGDDIASLLSAVGYKIEREFYVNDVGNQIDKLEASVRSKIDGTPLPENGYGGEYISELALQLKNETKDLRKNIIDAMLSSQKNVLEKLGVKFDRFFSEASLHKDKKVKAAVRELEEKNVTFKEDGALWFKSQEFGDDKNRVLVRENGETTYFAADIAYHLNKFERGYDHIIDIWGADHHGYVARLKSAIKALGCDVAKFEVIIGQLVSLFRGKEPVRMSKRTGEMITLEEVVDEVGRDATRFFMTMTSVNSHLAFDMELAKQAAPNNPVYYVQYAHARISSILREASARGIVVNEIPNLSLLVHPSERKLIRKLLDLPDNIVSSARKREPHLLVEYAKEVSAIFHNFYHNCRVISDDNDLTSARLVLADSCRIVIKNVLDLLKVSAPEKM